MWTVRQHERAIVIPPVTLAGLRVLVVEDEMLISLMIEEILIDEDCVIIGPFDRVPKAVAAAQTEAIDVALLDMNIAGVKVLPVALALEARKIPFLFLSGYGQNAVPPDRPDWRICTKPFRQDDLLKMLRQEFQKGR